MSSHKDHGGDVSVGRGKKIRINKNKDATLEGMFPSSCKRQKAEETLEDHERKRKKPKAGMKQVKQQERQPQQRRRPVIVLEPGDDAVLSCSIMDRVRTFTKHTPSHNIRTCIEGTLSRSYYSTVQHIQQRDKWSCGFRNLQMILSAILPHIPSSHTIFQHIPFRVMSSIPTLLQLQQALERAWQEGFDSKGADHYGHCIIGKCGPRAHVGAMEVANLARYLGVDATVVQFIKCHQSRRMLPKFVQSYFYKANGIQACPFCSYYYRNNSSNSSKNKKNDDDNDDGSGVRVTSKYCVNGLLQQSSMQDFPLPEQPECQCPLLPLYLQWEGHSVTIIGIEEDENNKTNNNKKDNKTSRKNDNKDDFTFLVLDPLQPAGQVEREFNKHQSVKPLRLPANSLAKKDTQIILWTLLPLTYTERVRGQDQSKINNNNNDNVVTAAEDAVLLHIKSTVVVVN
jgi:hypothetical protein